MFARHFGKSPAVLGLEDVRDYQLYLTDQKKLDASSIQVAVSALRFLYRVTLKRQYPANITGRRQSAGQRSVAR